MSGVWSGLLNLDMVIPSNARPVPGSGAIYIGGPRLPVGMKGAFAGGVVFFSDSAGLAAGIDYWYLAHSGSNQPPHDSDGIELGHYPTGGPTCVSNYSAFVSVPAGQRNITIDAPDFITAGAGQSIALLTNNDDIQLFSGGGLIFSALSGDASLSTSGTLFLSSNKAGPAAIQVTAPGADNIVIGKGVAVGNPRIEIKGWSGGGTDIYIKASDSRQDKWYSQTVTGTVGGQSMTCYIDWRVTPDFILDLRGQIQFPAPPTTFDFSFPVSIPYTIDNPPTSGVGMATFGDSGGVGSPRTIRTFMTSGPNTINVQGGMGNPSGYRLNYFSMIGTVLKP